MSSRSELESEKRVEYRELKMCNVRLQNIEFKRAVMCLCSTSRKL